MVELSICMHKQNSSPKSVNGITSHQQGGAITSFQSRISLYGTCILMHNEDKNGGAILATESRWFLYCELLAANSTATVSGGGACLYQSEFNSKDHSTFQLLNITATENGGGIHAISSLIKVDDPGSSLHLITNDANVGGSLSRNDSILKYDFVYRNYPLHFFSISAHYGGAVYVADETNFGTCMM